MKNIEVEIQAKIEDAKEAEKKLKEKGKFIGIKKQIDKYFVPPHKDFFSKKQPIEYLRIRYEKDKNQLMYSFLHFDKKGWLLATDEYQTLVENPETVEEILKGIGCILKIIVVKERKYFNCGSFEVVLDKIENLGNFIEVEAKKDFGGVNKTYEACMNFLKDLNIKYEIKKDMGYPNMLYRKLKKEKLTENK